MLEEIKDRELFDRIAKKYSRKDYYPVSRAARKFQLDSLIELCPKNRFAKILELGCGPGYNSVYLENKFEAYYGIDISKECIEIARQLQVPHAIFRQGNAKDLSQLKNEKFDLILGVGVLHHVDDVNEVLRNIEMLCTQDTLVAFIEPFSGNPLVQMLRFIRKVIDKKFNKEQSSFKKSDIKKLFAAPGFKIDKIRYQGYFSPPFAQVILKPMVLFKPICALAILVDKFIQKRLNNPLSWNIIWTARKISD